MTRSDSQAEAVYQAHDETVEKTTATGVLHKEEDLSKDPPKHKKFLCWSLSKKKWLAAVLASVLTVLLVVLLVVFLAIVPSIFQKYMNKVQMSVNYLDIKTLPADPNDHKIDVGLSLRLAYDASASATMEDATATLFYRNKPFGSVTLPAQKFNSSTGASFELKIRNVAEISDPAVFRELSKALVTDQQVAIDTRADVKARAMGLSYGGLKLDRTFTIKAFENFKEPKPRVNNITLAECTPRAYKLLINATLDNDSQVGIGGVGGLNLSVYHEQNYLGQALSMDETLGLPRGPTDMMLELTILQSPQTTAALMGMVGGLLGNGVQFFIRGNHPYATKAPLLSEAFAALNISMLYTDGLSKLTLNPQCNLLSILTGGR